MSLFAAEIHIEHPLVVLNIIDAAFAEHRALVEDRHFAPGGDLADEDHVVLDDDNGVLAGQ